jgi:hypothetical protein
MSHYNNSNNPLVWGPLMWNLLNEFASHSDIYCNDCYLKDFQNIIRELPYILPCKTCQDHCKEAYETEISSYINEINDFGKWVWTLKSIVNAITHERNILYDKYKIVLNSTRIFINEHQLWKLLTIVCRDYSENNDIYEYDHLLTFLKAMGHLCRKINHLNKFKVLIGIHELCDGKYFNINNVLEKIKY